MKDDGKKKKRSQYWRNFYKSAHARISRGAANIFKIISWARKDNWRRSDKKKMK